MKDGSMSDITSTSAIIRMMKSQVDQRKRAMDAMLAHQQQVFVLKHSGKDYSQYVHDLPSMVHDLPSAEINEVAGVCFHLSKALEQVASLMDELDKVELNLKRII